MLVLGLALLVFISYLIGVSYGLWPRFGPQDEIDTILRQMTLREKICQLFIVLPEQVIEPTENTGEDQDTEQADLKLSQKRTPGPDTKPKPEPAPPPDLPPQPEPTEPPAITQVGPEVGIDMEAVLSKYPVGGFFLNSPHLISQAQVRALTQGLQKHSKIPLILTCDEEGGRVSRLMETVGTTPIGPMLSYQDQGPAVATANARTIARDMTALGFNMDLAPVADVWSNPTNTVIGDRAYSTDFDQAADLIRAAVLGFHSPSNKYSLACTLKHFPGHGDTTADSHDGTVYVEKTLEYLRREELKPFQAGIDAGADAVMIGHLVVRQVDPTIAPLSHKITTELLRDEMRFQGVILTDSLLMGAVTSLYTPEDLAVRAIEAGVDMLLCPAYLDRSLAALQTAVETGRLPESRIDASVRRILTLKANRGILQGEEE